MDPRPALRPGGDAGISLVEVVVAAAILGLVAVFSLPAVVPALRATRDAPLSVAAARVADRELEAVRATPCADLPWATPTTGSRTGADPAVWTVTGSAGPVVFTGEPRRRWREGQGDTTRQQACAVDASGRPAGTGPYSYSLVVTSVARPGVSVSLTTSLFQGVVR